MSSIIKNAMLGSVFLSITSLVLIIFIRIKRAKLLFCTLGIISPILGFVAGLMLASNSSGTSGAIDYGPFFLFVGIFLASIPIGLICCFIALVKSENSILTGIGFLANLAPIIYLLSFIQ